MKQHILLMAGVFAASLSLPMTGSAADKAAVTPAALVPPVAILAPTAPVPGVTATEIRIGSSLPLSGTARGTGEAMKIGVLAVLDPINAAGGINGRKINVTFVDDGYDPARAKANTEKFLKDGTFALAFYFGTATSSASRALFSEQKVPFFGALSGSGVLRSSPNDKNSDPLIFNVRASYQQEVDKILESAINSGYTKIAVVQQDDGYGDAVRIGVEKYLAGIDKKPMFVSKIARNSEDATAAVKQVLELRPEVVVMGLLALPAAAMIRPFKDVHGSKRPLFYGVSPIGTAEFEKSLGASGAGVLISQIVPNPRVNGIPIVKEYQDAMKAKGLDPEYTSFEYYIAAKIFAKGLKDAGRDLTREKFIGALNAMDTVDIGGFIVDYSRNHRGSSFVDIVMLNGKGKYIN